MNRPRTKSPAKPGTKPRAPSSPARPSATATAVAKHPSVKGLTTRRNIVDSATTLFTERGYEATSIEVVLEKSGISRGALYHHFDSKEALYVAVLEAVEARVADATAAASRHLSDPREALRAGCNAWIELAGDRTVRQIVLHDAPAVVGWSKWREIDARFGFGQLKVGLGNAARAGWMRPELVDTMAHILLAALLEIALLIARSEHPKVATRDGRAALDKLLKALLSDNK